MEQKELFGNIDDIILANTDFYSALISTAGKERLSKVPAIISDFMGNRFMCYAEYCCNHQKACSLIKSRKIDVAATDGLDLASLLLEPVQRITRYPLLIRQIVDCLGDDEDGGRLCGEYRDSLSHSQILLDAINAAIGENENWEKLKELDVRLEWSNFKVNLTEPCSWGAKRQLLISGIQCLDKAGTPIICHLFTDFCLILFDNNNAFKVIGDPWPIEQIDFDGSAIVHGPDRANLVDPGDEMLCVKLRESVDAAQQAFFRGLDNTIATPQRESVPVGSCILVIQSCRNLYTLPSKYPRLPEPFLRISRMNRGRECCACYESPSSYGTDPDFDNYLLELPVESACDVIEVQVLDKRPFAQPLPMGRHYIQLGNLVDYFDGICSEHSIALEGCPRGILIFSITYKSSQKGEI